MPQKPFYRFLLGAGIALFVVLTGFALFNSRINTWGSTPEEIKQALPADELVRNPSLVWNHAITIDAPPEQVYPWLVQIGDSRAAFYSIAFIENAFCATSGDCHYTNAGRIHPEWQTPEKGKQGIIMDYMVIQDYQPDQWVLAVPTEKMPFQWTWLWYVQPGGSGSSRLIVRHRVSFPPDVPRGVIDGIFATGYMMERAMLLGIRARAEGAVPLPVEEGLGALLWLAVFGMGVACAVRFVRVGDGYHSLGVGLEAILVLFVLTYIQPPLFVRLLLVFMVAAGVWVAFRREQSQRLFRTIRKPARKTGSITAN